jgi:hypothetical protein
LFTREASAALGCDPSWIALAALVTTASLIGNTRSIRLKKGWLEPCILWGVIIGASGTLKTPALKVVVGILQQVQDRLREEHAVAVKEYEKDLTAYENKKSDAKKAKAKGDEAEDLGPPPVEPILQRVMVSDITIEQLCAVLEDCPRGTLLYRDELSAWFGSFCRYKAKGAGSDCPHYLSMYSGAPVIYDRKTGERRSIYVPRAALGILGGTQPGTFARALTPEYFEAGLPARFLLAMPPTGVKVWKEDTVSEVTEKAVADLFEALLKLEPDPDKSKLRKPVPLACWLPDEAKALWKGWYNDWATVQAQSEGELAACYSKLEAVAARLALLHHVVTTTRQDKIQTWIPPESMLAGITLARWFAHESVRVYTALSQSEEEQQLRNLVEQIQRHGGSITARDLRNASKSRYPDTDTATAALEQLVKAGLGRWEAVRAGASGGRPTKKLILELRNHETDETSDDAFAEHEEAGEDVNHETSRSPQEE